MRPLTKKPTLAETIASLDETFWQQAIDSLKTMARRPGPNQAAAKRIVDRMKL